jgi:hypothetical protein
LVSYDPIPIVVITASDVTSSVDKTCALINRFATIDDVYSKSFAHVIVLQSTIGSTSDKLFAQFKASGRFSAVYHTALSSPSNALPPGPYFLVQGSIHQAYRLYEDELDSFIFGVIPQDVFDPKKFKNPSVAISNSF